MKCGLVEDNPDGYLEKESCVRPLAVTEGHTLNRNQDGIFECTGCGDTGETIQKFSYDCVGDLDGGPHFTD